MQLVTEVGLGPGVIVLDGDPSPIKRGTAAPPLFGWIKTPLGTEIPLGTEVDLGSDHIVLDGVQLRPPRTLAHQPPPPHHFLVHVYCGQMVAHLSYC